MKELIYNKQHEDFKLEVFKDSEINELTDNAYEIIGTNITTGSSDSVTTRTPQGAIALVNNVILELEHSSRRIQP
jgi:hypothetical protein